MIAIENIEGKTGRSVLEARSTLEVRDRFYISLSKNFLFKVKVHSDKIDHHIV